MNDDAFASYYCFSHYVHWTNHSTSLACWISYCEFANYYLFMSLRFLWPSVRQCVRIENNIVCRFDSFATDRSTKEKRMWAEEEDEKSLICAYTWCIPIFKLFINRIIFLSRLDVLQSIQTFINLVVVFSMCWCCIWTHGHMNTTTYTNGT